MPLAERARFGIAGPHIFPDGIVDTNFIKTFVGRAELAGYASLWTQERVTGSPTALDPTTFLSYVAGQTERIRLGISVFVLPRHNPIHMAKQMASLDNLSGGRLTFGVGLGANARDLAQYSVSSERRVKRFTEQVSIIKSLWTESPTSFHGVFYDIESANIEPKPLQKPHPPIWFGGHVESALTRAIRLADGWTGAGSAAREAFESQVAFIQEQLDSEGRARESFPISKRVYLAIDDDESRALRRLRDWFAYYYGSADLANKVGIWGTTERVLDTVERWTDLGVSEFILNPVFDLEDHLEKLADAVGLS